MGWLSGYTYRKQITIAGSAAGAVTDYQMQLTVHKGSGSDLGSDVYLDNHCQDDFDDVRFSLADGETPLDYWRESYESGVAGVFWVEFDSIPASPDTETFYLYYGQATALDGSNIANTFVVGDDFESWGMGWPKVVLTDGTNKVDEPDVIETAAGSILMARMEDAPSAFRVRVHKSTDGGATFTEKLDLGEDAGMNPVLIQLADGTIWLIYADYDGSALLYRTSTDDGENWSAESTLENSEATESAAIQLSNGRFIVAWVLDDPWQTVKCKYSDNNGSSWSALITVGSTIKKYEGLDMVACGTGDVLLAVEEEWAEGGYSRIEQFRSEDDGASWASEGFIWDVANADVEEGAYLNVDGDIWFITSTDEDNTGLSYAGAKLKFIKSTDNGDSYGAATTIYGKFTGAKKVKAVVLSGGQLYIVFVHPTTKADVYAFKESPSDIEAGLANTQWVRAGGATSTYQVDVANSELILTGESWTDDEFFYSVQAIAQTCVIHAQFRCITYDALLGNWQIGLSDADPPDTGQPTKGSFYPRAASDQYRHSALNWLVYTDEGDIDDATHTHDAYYWSAYHKSYRDGAQKLTEDLDATPAGWELVLRQGNGRVAVDCVFVRKYVDPEPTWGAWGSEETEAGGWANIAKVSGIATGSIARISGVAVGDIGKIGGVAV